MNDDLREIIKLLAQAQQMVNVLSVEDADNKRDALGYLAECIELIATEIK